MLGKSRRALRRSAQRDCGGRVATTTTTTVRRERRPAPARLLKRRLQCDEDADARRLLEKRGRFRNDAAHRVADEHDAAPARVAVERQNSRNAVTNKRRLVFQNFACDKRSLVAALSFDRARRRFCSPLNAENSSLKSTVNTSIVSFAASLLSRRCAAAPNDRTCL